VEDIPVRIDPERLGLAIANIVLNAVDALRNSPLKRVETAMRVADGHALLVIRDTGPGLSDPVKAQLFEPFFTTKPSDEGLGLGLSLSQESLASMGGRIEAGNHAGGGAEFVLVIPLA
jgi:two-component system C4-dicarboxylate transport sensor histidine kinase DctB